MSTSSTTTTRRGASAAKMPVEDGSSSNPYVADNHTYNDDHDDQGVYSVAEASSAPGDGNHDDKEVDDGEEDEEGDGDYEIDTESLDVHQQQQQQIHEHQRQQVEARTQQQIHAQQAFYHVHQQLQQQQPMVAHSHLSSSSSTSSSGAPIPPGPQPIFHAQAWQHPDLAPQHHHPHAFTASPSPGPASYVGRPMYMAEHHLAPRPASAQPALYGSTSASGSHEHHHMQQQQQQQQHDAMMFAHGAGGALSHHHHHPHHHFLPEAMTRSYSDPFAASGPGGSSAAAGAGVGSSSGAHPTGSMLSPEAMFTVAPGSIGGAGNDAVYRTPLAKGSRAAAAGGVGGVGVGSGGGMMPMSSPYTTDEPGSAQKYGSSSSRSSMSSHRGGGGAGGGGADTPTFSHRSLTPASTYSAGDSTYQPSNLADSVERRKRDFAASPTMAGDEDEDEYDEDHVGAGGGSKRNRYPQSSPLRGRKGGKHGKQAPTSLVPGSSKSKSGRSAASSKRGGSSSALAAAGASGKDASSSSSSSKKDAKAANVTAAKEDYVPEGVPPGPRSAEKPHYSYAALIGQAINACPRRRLALSQIYAWISAAYPFFKKGDAGWMNSIRHNLSLNDCFVKNDRKTEDAAGKGSVWMIADGCDYMFAGGGFKKTNRNKVSPPTDKAEVKKQSPTGQGATVAAMPESAPGSTPTQPMHNAIVSGPTSHTLPPSSSPLDGKKCKIGEVAIPFVPAYGPTGPHHYGPSPSAPGQQQIHIYSPMPPPPMAGHAAADMGPDGKPAGLDTSMPPPSRPKRSNTGPGIMEIDDPSSVDARHVAKLRQMPSSSPAQGCAPGSLRVAREAGLHSSPAMSHLQPSTLLQEAARKRTHDALMDDFTTPHRQIKVPRKDHVLSSVGGYDMLPPHLTPSASSPVSSPAPQTVGRHDSDASAPIIIHQDDSESDGQDAVETRKLGGVKAQLEPGVEFVAPALPPSKQTQLLSSPSSKLESVTLSPIRRSSRNDANGAALNLPGPDELLSKAKLPGPNELLKSPRNANLHRRLPSSDFLVSFGSPIRSASKAELFTTPLGKESGAASRLRSLNTPNFSTPMRSSNGIHHIFNETPAGATKRQFMAEHGLLESPMGLSGSCYDIGNTEVQIDWAMEAFSNNGPGSPTRAGPHHHRRLPSQILSTPL